MDVYLEKEIAPYLLKFIQIIYQHVCILSIYFAFISIGLRTELTYTRACACFSVFVSASMYVKEGLCYKATVSKILSVCVRTDKRRG